jgi:D-arginine dehydrogenase
MVSLSDETPSDPCDAFPDDFDVAVALDRFHTATIVPPVRPTASWAGLRTFAPDRVPIVGFEPEAPGFFWYAGQGGYGIQTAPALSQLGASLILHDPLHGAETEVAAALSPDRFTQSA